MKLVNFSSSGQGTNLIVKDFHFIYAVFGTAEA